MQLFKIHKMRWANQEKSIVTLIADTDTGMNEEIHTPYSNESIIWDDVKSFPVDGIGEFVPVPIDDVNSGAVSDVDFVDVPN